MPKRSSKKPLDPNEIAASVVLQATQDAKAEGEHAEKNPAAVALGRLGGLRGGKARAKALSAEKRSRIAKAAARARWKRH